MKLLRINIHGFKSFADKTVIDIKDGITGNCSSDFDSEFSMGKAELQCALRREKMVWVYFPERRKFRKLILIRPGNGR